MFGEYRTARFARFADSVTIRQRLASFSKVGLLISGCLHFMNASLAQKLTAMQIDLSSHLAILTSRQQKGVI